MPLPHHPHSLKDMVLQVGGRPATLRCGLPYLATNQPVSVPLASLTG